MDIDDPFNSFTSQCHISSSQEQLLRNSPFARELEKGLYFEEPDSAEFPAVSTGIVMVSPPDSLEEKDENAPIDVFQTPPEETVVVTSSEEPPAVVGEKRDDTVVVDDDFTAVDLSRDTDLGFSEMESIRLCDVGGVSRVEVFEDAVEKRRVLKRDLDFEKGLSERPLKKSKNLWKCLGLDSPIATEEQKKIENLMISIDLNSKSDRATPLQCNAEKLGEKNCSESVKKKLKFSDVPVVGNEVVDLNCEGSDVKGSESDESRLKEDLAWKEIREDVQCAVRNKARYGADNLHTNGVGIGGRKCIDDIEKYRYTGRSSGVCRVLPLSICRREENAASEGQSGNLYPNNVMLTFLHVLKEIGKQDYDPTELKYASILEIAISRGMTFPRPRWWPESW